MSCLKQNIRTTHSLMWVSVQSLRGHNTSCSTKDPKLAELVGLRKFHVAIKKGACILDSKKMKTLQANHVKASLKGKEPQVQDTGSQAPQANLAAVAETLTSLNVLLTSRMLQLTARAGLSDVPILRATFIVLSVLCPFSTCSSGSPLGSAAGSSLNLEHGHMKRGGTIITNSCGSIIMKMVLVAMCRPKGRTSLLCLLVNGLQIKDSEVPTS